MPLYFLLKEKKLKLKEIGIVLSLYITNPIVVMYSRILWNPSPLIGLGLWAVFFLQRSAIVFGIIAGVSFYFHYFALILAIWGGVFYIKEKKYISLLKSIIAFILTLSPFALFEIKNKFYLTQSFIFNLQNTQESVSFYERITFFLQTPVQLLGMINDPFNTRLIEISGLAILVGSVLWILISKKNIRNIHFYLFLFACILTAFASSSYIRIQYLFISIGAFIAYCINPKRLLVKYLLIFIILLQSINTFYMVSERAKQYNNDSFPTIAELELASDTIQKLHVHGKTFNITENITGDARALYLRFFLERDKMNDLNSELQYENLEELYVLTPSLHKTIEEERWEFTATKDLRLTKQIPIGEFILLHYTE